MGEGNSLLRFRLTTVNPSIPDNEDYPSYVHCFERLVAGFYKGLYFSAISSFESMKTGLSLIHI